MIDYRFTYFNLDLKVLLPNLEGSLIPFLKAYFEPYIKISPSQGQATYTPIACIGVEVGMPPIEVPNKNGSIEIDIDRSKAFLQCTGKYIDQGEIRWVWMLPSKAIVRIDRNTSEIKIWGPTQDSLRVPVLRIVEDLLSNAIQRREGVIIHASGVVANGQAVIAIGNKGAGKTSILCRLLHSFNVAKLANDNVCIAVRKDHLVARGWPAFFKVEVATVSSLRELAVDFPEEHRAILNNSDALWNVYNKVALYPSQGASRFSAGIEVEAPLGAIILPNFSKDKSPELHQVNVEEVASQLPEYLQGIFNPNHSDWLAINSVTSNLVLKTLDSVVDAIKSFKVPLYRLNWCPSLDDLLGQVPELRKTQWSLIDCQKDSENLHDYPPLPTISPDDRC
ncbi:MAG: hypothetical protein KME42_08370 [Tildeniella nuda ZEHNDER 1965/U140]|jgi:hypothetical protein|nr:hypothetical protein [Tildeniella nuda ZEHNDER 1965/U140]